MSGNNSISSEIMSDDGSESSSSSLESLSSDDSSRSSSSSSSRSSSRSRRKKQDDESMSLDDVEVESSSGGSASSGCSEGSDECPTGGEAVNSIEGSNDDEEEDLSYTIGKEEGFSTVRSVEGSDISETASGISEESGNQNSISVDTNRHDDGDANNQQSQQSHNTSNEGNNNVSDNEKGIIDEQEKEDLAAVATNNEESGQPEEEPSQGGKDEKISTRSDSSNNDDNNGIISSHASDVSSVEQSDSVHSEYSESENEEDDRSSSEKSPVDVEGDESQVVDEVVNAKPDNDVKVESNHESKSSSDESSESENEDMGSSSSLLSKESLEKEKEGESPSDARMDDDGVKASEKGGGESLVDEDYGDSGSGLKVDVEDGNNSDESTDGKSNEDDYPVVEELPQNTADETKVAAANSLDSETSDDAESSRGKVEANSNSLGGGSAFTALTSIDGGSSTAPLNSDEDQINIKKTPKRSPPPPPPAKRAPPLPPKRLTQEGLQKQATDNSAYGCVSKKRGSEVISKLALQGLDEWEDPLQNTVLKSLPPVLSTVTETSKPTEETPDDVDIGDTSQLTPMEKLKLAAKYGSEKNVGKVQFLLESSIRDLETMDLDAEGKHAKDAKRTPRTPETYGSKTSRSEGRRSHNSKRSDRSGNHRNRPRRQSRSSRGDDKDKTETQKEWESYLNRNSTSGATVPQGVKDVLACVKKSDPLPRESVVSNVVRELVTMRVSHEVTERCVAILGENENGEGGVGKSTVAALVCNRGDIRTRYHGISWIGMGSESLDFERYSKNLSDICRQIGVKPHHLRLSPFVRSPGEDAVVANLRMKAHMEEARYHMGKLLTSVQRKRWKSRHKSLLFVLDNVADESEIEWFQFRNGGEGGNINDIVVTSRLSEINGAIVVTVPPLSTKESTHLFLTESDLPPNHRISNTSILKDFLKTCNHHPLTVRYAGRWLNLKRATAGGHKGTEEVLAEINEAVKDVVSRTSCLDVLYAMMLRSMSPLVKGTETKIIRLCFAAFVTVFCKESYSATIPFEVATEFFLKVVENESSILSNEDTLFKSHGRRASMLVPQILGALGVFSITKHSTTGTDSEKKESSIKIDSEVIHGFCEHIFNDISMQHLVRHSKQRWNEAYVQSYLQAKSNFFWDNLQPDKSRKYALGKAPLHMIQAEMYNDVESLLRNESFIRGRFWYLGWTEGITAHVNDVEHFWERVKYERDESDVIATFEQLESVLMEEVARESGGPNGRCTTLEAGRCLHEISLSLAKIGLFKNATRFCHSCIKLVESNLGPSELVAALLYNSSMIHVEANEFGIAEERISECMKIRVKTSGQENILYVRSLCLMGDILSTMSDYATAQSCYDKAIGILKVIPPQYHLDFGIVLYKLGRNQHRRGGYLDDALQCYEEALEFEKLELGGSHSFIASLLTKKGEVLLENDDVDQAIQNFKDALTVLNDALKIAGDDSSSPYLRSKILILEGLLLSVSAESNKCIVKYKQGLKLLKKFAPSKKIKMAQLTYLVGSEYEKQDDYKAADKLYQDSIVLVKEVLGPTHLDIAETLVNQSGVKSALGQNDLATTCLEDAIDIQRTRSGDCEEVAITLTILGVHLKGVGDYKKAEQAYNEAVQILRSLNENDDLDLSLVDALLGLAGLLNEISEYVQAMECYVECLEIQKNVYGKSHDDIASTLYAMGLTKNNQKLYSRALTFFQKALDIRVGIHGEADSSVRDTHSIMGFTDAVSGDLDGALRKLADALRVSQLLGDRLKEAETLSNIGNVHREKEEWELALEHYDNCMSIRIAELGHDHESVADALMAIGNVKSDLSKHEDAVNSYKDGESSLPFIRLLGFVYVHSDTLLLTALRILLRVVPVNNKRIASTVQKIGMIQFRAGNLEGATLHLQKAVEIYRQDGKELIEADVVTCLFVIGNIHHVLNQKDKAKDVWAQALETNNALGDKGNGEIHRALGSILSIGA